MLEVQGYGAGHGFRKGKNHLGYATPWLEICKNTCCKKKNQREAKIAKSPLRTCP